ncbi:cytochrome c oxidase assembly protein subunit 15 [Solimonas aquatica]|uniref:Cytochrome c oxidase assembly protein subunit 15 n=1 Tax=Solimonas aquatica TaxID=489703 RepID=A0A1H9BR46_9GAMM|nr:COX15/CtaA family protein [Solimonas aquatica]SEP91454.1 cytochrome c oxidase assembly protein subunit 15 [Solimonas aquatica]
MLWFRRLNLIAMIWCFCLVVVGAYVRLSDAGLGCPDWPGCYGHLTVPDAPHEVQAAEQQFPQRPVEAPKAWKEMIHRYLAETLGLFITVLALMSLFGRQPGLPKKLPIALLGVVIFQGVLGMWTVTWQLKPLAVTGHLLGGMTTFSLLLWMWLSTRPQAAADRTPPVSSGLRRFATLGLIVVALQIFLGGWTSTNYAALACPDFPSCQHSYLPDLDVQQAFTLWHGLGINYEHGILDARARVTIHYFHRLGALLVCVVLIALGSALLRQAQARWRWLGRAVLAALLLQISIGVGLIHLQWPLWLAALHNLGAELLLGTLVALNYFVRDPARSVG